MLKKSLTTRSTVDPELFPLLTIRSCVSEAVESANGPRFCAQDNLTGCVYEVRYTRVPLSRPSTDLSKKDLAVLKKQQSRISVIMDAAGGGAKHPPCVALPIDVYLQEQASSGATYVAAVDEFAGMSLGDIARSGVSVVEEHTFFEILGVVEQFGCAAASLPPHGNITPDAVKQLLTVRDGAAEAEHRSRWVIGDWKLSHDEANVTFDAVAFVADVEWMLHSAFSQLNVISADGIMFAQNQVEAAINDVVERIRGCLIVEPARAMRAEIEASLQRDAKRASQRLSSGTKSGGEDDDHGPTTGVSSSAEMGSLSTSAPATTSTGVDDVVNGIMSKGGEVGVEHHVDPHSLSHPRNVQDLARDLSLRDRIAFHQAELRREQQLANKYRRRNAPLPPLPAPPPSSGSRLDAKELETMEYEMHYLVSPIKPQPSRYLSERTSSCETPPSPAAGAGRAARSSSRKRSTVAERAAGVARSRSQDKTRGSRSDNVARSITRQHLLEQVITLALATQQAKTKQAVKQRESERAHREALRSFLARSATASASNRQQQEQRHQQQQHFKAASPLHASTARDVGGSRSMGGTGDRVLSRYGSTMTPATPPQKMVRNTSVVELGGTPQNTPPKPVSNRRGLGVPEQAPTPTRPHVTTTTGGSSSPLGASLLIQVSHSGPSDDTKDAVCPGNIMMPVVAPLPLGPLLEARERAAAAAMQQQQKQRRALSRNVPPQHSVRGSPRPQPSGAITSDRRGATGSRSPTQAPQHSYAVSRGSPRDGVVGSPRPNSARASPRQHLSATGTNLGTPLSPSPSPSAHPHGLSASSPRDVAAAAWIAAHPSSPIQRGKAGKGTDGAPEGRITPSRTPQTGGGRGRWSGLSSSPRPSGTPRGQVSGIRVEEPRADPAYTVAQTPAAAPAEVRLPNTARSPRGQQQQHTRATPRTPGGGAKPTTPGKREAQQRVVPAAKQSAPVTAKAATPKERGRPASAAAAGATGGKAAVPPRSPSAGDKVKRREVRPVHEASMTAEARRRMAGAYELW